MNAFTDMRELIVQLQLVILPVFMELLTSLINVLVKRDGLEFFVMSLIALKVVETVTVQMQRSVNATLDIIVPI